MKGSYEKIVKLIDARNIPDGFEELARQYSALGYYVIRWLVELLNLICLIYKLSKEASLKRIAESLDSFCLEMS